MALAFSAFFGVLAAQDIANRQPFSSIWWLCVIVWLLNSMNILSMALA